MKTVIVYQLGKVASTSIVSTLNQIDSIEAYQSHFLGYDAFCETVKKLIDPKVDPFFIKHGTGQLLNNMVLMRKVNAYKAGLEREDSLIILSLIRDPVDWFRSCLAQEMEGYLRRIKQIAMRRGHTFTNHENAIQQTLPILVKQICVVIETCGGIDRITHESVIAVLNNDPKTFPAGERGVLLDLLYVFLRPFRWFDQYFKPLFNLTLEDITENQNGLRHKALSWCDIYLMRYEDINRLFPLLLKCLGMEYSLPLVQDNISEKKRYADVIKGLFDSGGLDADLRNISHSRMCTFFGYQSGRDVTVSLDQ